MWRSKIMSDEADELAALLDRASIADSDDVKTTGIHDGSSGTSRPHSSLTAMLSLAALEVLRVCGDGNCGYYAAVASLGTLDPAALRAIDLWELQHAQAAAQGRGGMPTPDDYRLQEELRRRCVEWLQRAEHAHHRYVGTSSAPLVPDEQHPGRFKTPPPPVASAMEVHRRNGTYATMPCLKAMAEVLKATIISIDSSKLYDRVPVFVPEQPTKTCQIRSWRTQLAPQLLARASSSSSVSSAASSSEGATASPPGRRSQLSERVIVIVNNGQQGAGGHFDATVRST